MENKRYTVKLGNIDKVEQLLQESYDLACRQFTQIQQEINKIANTTIINDLDIDGKEKYAKIMNNYITLQQKTITQKFDIAKLMSEIIKHNGDVNGAIDSSKGNSTLDLAKLKSIAMQVNKNPNETTEVYNLKK